jgi:PKD repeat protein
MVLALAACGTTKPAASVSHSACKPAATPSLAPSPPGDQQINYQVKISQGETVKRPIAVLAHQFLLAVFAAWQYGRVQFSLISPSGKVYDANTTDPAANHHFQPDGESFAIERPAAGQWTIQLVGDAVPTTGGKVYIQITEMPMSDFAPIALAQAKPDRGVAPVTVQFTAQVDGFQGATIASYHWDFGDCSPVSSEQNPTHVFKSAGTYAVVLTGTDSDDQSDSAVETITVTAIDHPPTATFGWASVDAGNPNVVSFDARDSNDIDGQIQKYEWDFGDGSTGTGDSATHTYARSGTYTVTLKVTDNGGLTATGTQAVTTGGYSFPTAPPTPSP